MSLFSRVSLILLTCTYLESLRISIFYLQTCPTFFLLIYSSIYWYLKNPVPAAVMLYCYIFKRSLRFVDAEISKLKPMIISSSWHHDIGDYGTKYCILYTKIDRCPSKTVPKFHLLVCI